MCGGVYCFHVVGLYVCTSVMFWFLLLILPNSSRNLFIFCINVDIDEVLLFIQIRAKRLIPLELFPFVILEKLLFAFYLAK